MLRKEEIINLKDPLNFFGTADQLAKHKKVLNSLESKDQIDLATRLVESCDGSTLCNFRKNIKALRHPISNRNNTFYNTVKSAVELKDHLLVLEDQNNPKPYEFFTNQFNIDNFNRFPTIVEKNFPASIAFAEKIALTTPKDKRSKISRFPMGVADASLIREAFVVQSELESLINKPEVFIANINRNIASFEKFPNLCTTFIRDNEKVIADSIQKLSPIDKKSIFNSLKSLKNNELNTLFGAPNSTINSELNAIRQQFLTYEPSVSVFKSVPFPIEGAKCSSVETPQFN